MSMRDPYDPLEDGGVAFPIRTQNMVYMGMSLRDYFASQTLNAHSMYGPNGYELGNPEHRKRMARDCYAMADAMLAERAKWFGTCWSTARSRSSWVPWAWPPRWALSPTSWPTATGATMAGKPSASMIAAMKLVMIGVTAYDAALRLQLNPGTMYRSRLYKLWREGGDKSLKALKDELDYERPRPRVKKLNKKSLLRPKRS